MHTCAARVAALSYHIIHVFQNIVNKYYRSEQHRNDNFNKDITRES